MKVFPIGAALLAGLTLAVSLLGCNGGGGGSDPNLVRIVSSLPRTGSAKQQTDTIVNGIKMALEEVDYKAGEFKIEYLDLDDATASAGQWTAEQERANASKAARDPSILVYIGTYNSGAAKIAIPILNQAGLLMISPANTAVGLTKPSMGEPGEPEIYRKNGITYVRVVPTDDLQGTLAAEWAKDMGVKKVYVLDDKEFYGRGIAVLFAARCREIGIEVLDHQSIDAKALEFKSLMTTIKASDPDLVYFGGTTQSKGGQIAKDLVDSGMDAKLMVPDGCMEEAFITSAGAKNLNGRCYVTFGGTPPDQLTGKGADFVKRYVEKHGKQPEAYAIYGYESAKVALESIRRAGKKDRAAVVDACLKIKDFPGALGTWSFDSNGDTTLKVLSGNIVKNGKFEFVRPLVDASVDSDNISANVEQPDTDTSTDDADEEENAEDSGKGR
ncbi:MAG: branched-chain amino acid ABC transporter substrate-binding protein [Pirellulales bacterium]